MPSMFAPLILAAVTEFSVPPPPQTGRELYALSVAATGCARLRKYAGLHTHSVIERNSFEITQDDVYGIAVRRWRETTTLVGQTIREGFDGQRWSLSEGKLRVSAAGRALPQIAWDGPCVLSIGQQTPRYSKPRRVYESGVAYDRTVRGRAETDWFDARTHLLARTKLDNERIDYRDYRRIHGVAFAFHSTHEDQTPPDSTSESVGGPDPIGRETLTLVEFLTSLPPNFAARPKTPSL